jgi:hypothetical protein
MKFLNGKEEVIDIEITSYGKYLISQGKFKPVYYSFFDDGVLYDNEYGGVSEPQNETQGRIKNDTPRLQAQANFSGVEEKIKKLRDRFDEETVYVLGDGSKVSVFPSDGVFDYRYNAVVPKENAFTPPTQDEVDKFYSLKYPIGTSDLNTSSAPSWNITALMGNISSSSNHLTSSYVTERIPQLNLSSVDYKTIVGKVPPNSDTSEYDYVFENEQGEAVNFINVMPGENELILSIEESNVFFGEQNFDIEVFLMEGEEEVTANKITNQLKPLYFTKEPTIVKDNILLDENSDEYAQQAASRNLISETEGDLGELRDLQLDSSYIDYYFSIDVDNEIDDETLCKLTIDKSQGIFSERYLDCTNIKKSEQFDNSDVFDGDSTVNQIGDCE